MQQSAVSCSVELQTTYSVCIMKVHQDPESRLILEEWLAERNELRSVSNTNCHTCSHDDLS